MNPIQVNCPECQKNFLVRPDDLTTGEQRFQCTGCGTYFSFPWPQPPGQFSVKTTRFEIKHFQQSPATPGAAPVPPPGNPNAGKPMRTCPHCGEKVELKLVECPKCGVVFDKVKKIRPPEPVLGPSGPDVVAAWEAVKANYADENRHESFVQLCLARESLPYASSQYRAILLANPSDDLAKRMQDRIVNLATTAYIAAQTVKRDGSSFRTRNLTGIALALSFLLVAIGIFTPPLRALVAVGLAIMAFIFVIKALNRKV